MNGYDWAVILFLALALILPLSALKHRAIPLNKIVRIGGIWVLIFLATALVFSWAGS